MSKVLVYTIQATFDALDPVAAQEAMRAVQELKEYGNAAIIAVELIEDGDVDDWPPGGKRP